MNETFQSHVYPICPLQHHIAFPGGITPLIITEETQIRALQEAKKKSKEIFLGYLKNTPEGKIKRKDLHPIGTIAEITQSVAQQDGSYKLLVEGLRIARLVEIVDNGYNLEGYAVTIEKNKTPSQVHMSLMRTVKKRLKEYSEYSDSLPKDLLDTINSTRDPLRFLNLASHYTSITFDEKYSIISCDSLEEKYHLLIQYLDAHLEIYHLEDKISQQVDQSMNRNQREYYLNEQLKAIEQELGVGGENDPDLKELEDAIEAADLPEEVRAKADREMRRLSRMQMMSPEANIARTYLEWLTEVPWHEKTQDQLDLQEAKVLLDQDHYGLDKIKERIVEYLAVTKLAGMGKGSILCLVGPPGVGKTSLGRSIAKCMGRKFGRIALGGVRDEAEIRGHRRTYIGAMPGRIIQAMKKAGVVNPVILLDEVDKLSSDFRGDPASALLEVLDPEQNNSFHDHYLDADYDLSQVMFVTTANSLSGIPIPLQDRLEIIRVAGYTEHEKLEIAVRHLIQKQRELHGLKASQVKISKATLLELISRYTREAGVRNLERLIAKLCRKIAAQVVGSGSKKVSAISKNSLPDLLGPEYYTDQDIGSKPLVGHVLGLAWTEAGGELLPVESSVMKGKGILTLTGQLGNVMQESAKASFSYCRAHANEWGIPEDFYEKCDVHVHVPEGAIPKDGPSAGVTLITSLVSLLSSTPVRQDVAMTGEITLQGRVLKIGGLKEKFLAAHRRKIKEIIIPKSNVGELVEIPEEIRQGLIIHPVEFVSEVLDIMLITESKDKKKGSTSTPRSRSKPKKQTATRATRTTSAT